MPALDTTVKIFDSAMAGAASLSNAAGNLIGVLDACLVNGFGQITCDSVSVAAGVATATKSTGHSAIAGAVVLIAGATPAGLNGEHKVISTTSTTVVFDAFGVADGAASGTITLKLAPAGWAKAFTGTNLAAYKSANGLATGFYLRIDDTTTTYARGVGYETMSDINTGTGQFPTTAQKSGGVYFSKSGATGARPWFIVANDRFCYLGIASNSNYVTSFLLYAFGDIAAYKSPDAYRFGIFAGGGDYSNAHGVTYQPIIAASYNATYMLNVFPRAVTGFQPPTIAAYSAAWLPVWVSGIASGYSGHAYPDPVINQLTLGPVAIVDSGAVRGELPGLLAVSNNTQAAIADKTVLDKYAPINKTLWYRTLSHSPASGYYAGVCFDLTGPWAS